MTDDPWHIERLDLDAYLARVGVPAHSPSRAALDQLLEAHVRTFTFDNIDVLLDQHPGVELESVQAKFVGRGRGGYCFEHSTLFAAALERLGYTVSRRLGRVGDRHATGRTHAVVVVSIDGEQLFCDAGFGFSTLRSIPLVDGAEDDYAGRSLRVCEVPEGQGRGWELYRRGHDGWEFAHLHDELPVRPVDLVQGHHFTSTFPSSHFRHRLMVTRQVGDAHLTLTESSVTTRRPGEPTEHRSIELGEIPEILGDLDVPLTDDELARLLDRLAEIRT
jgi:N-hydroxyarylamine O-acetyltransferase